MATLPTLVPPTPTTHTTVTPTPITTSSIFLPYFSFIPINSNYQSQPYFGITNQQTQQPSHIPISNIILHINHNNNDFSIENNDNNGNNNNNNGNINNHNNHTMIVTKQPQYSNSITNILPQSQIPLSTPTTTTTTVPNSFWYSNTTYIPTTTITEMPIQSQIPNLFTKNSNNNNNSNDNNVYFMSNSGITHIPPSQEQQQQQQPSMILPSFPTNTSTTPITTTTHPQQSIQNYSEGSFVLNTHTNYLIHTHQTNNNNSTSSDILGQQQQQQQPTKHNQFILPCNHTIPTTTTAIATNHLNSNVSLKNTPENKILCNHTNITLTHEKNQNTNHKNKNEIKNENKHIKQLNCKHSHNTHRHKTMTGNVGFKKNECLKLIPTIVEKCNEIGYSMSYNPTHFILIISFNLHNDFCSLLNHTLQILTCKQIEICGIQTISKQSLFIEFENIEISNKAKNILSQIFDCAVFIFKNQINHISSNHIIHNLVLSIFFLFLIFFLLVGFGWFAFFLD